MASDLDYLSHLHAESDRFAQALRSASPDARVPTCPDWDADDLLWHLAEVQWFWAAIVRDDVADPSTLERADRPADRDGLFAFFASASAELHAVLSATPPQAPRWTWSSEQTAGFTRRRQAHEALIHRVDAELTAEVDRAPMDPALSEDGVDEALRVMFAGVPDWGSTTPDPDATVLVTATDTGRSWWLTLGRFTGTDPAGEHHDQDDLLVADAADGQGTAGDHTPAATVSGSAADLDCWLWGRPASSTGAVQQVGETAVLRRLNALIGQGID